MYPDISTVEEPNGLRYHICMLECSITQWSIWEYWKLRPRYGMVLPLFPLLPTGNNDAMLAHG